jgi:hypothetical protein
LDSRNALINAVAKDAGSGVSALGERRKGYRDAYQE